MKSNSQMLFEKLNRADSLIPRMVGLLGRKHLSQDEAMWFTQCSGIHTWFMKISIDCVFVDSTGKIIKIYHHIKPWRFAGPVWKATDAIEMAAGMAKLKNLQVGDIIECGP